MTEATAPDLCISAARFLPADWAVVFLGVTWMRPQLEEQARREGVEDRVRFLDPVPPSELIGFTRAATVGLTPIRVSNRSERFALSNKLFEYMQAGLPIVTSEGTAQAEIVRELDAGAIIPWENSPESLAAATLALDQVPAEVARLRAARLRNLARERFCWEVESKVLLDVYAGIRTRA